MADWTWQTARRLTAGGGLVALMASPIVAQGLVVPLGEPVIEETLAPPPPATLPRASGFGWSGALRALKTAPGQILSLDDLAEFGAGWSGGHRWTAVHAGTDGPSVLGAPADSPAGYQAGQVRTPVVHGSWLLESQLGSVVQVLNQIPASEQNGAFLNGYHIGVYPTAGSSREDLYTPPNAFIEVTSAGATTSVSEHLTLSQFLTKDQFDIWPKYVALDFRLIDKLELVIQELNAMGIRADRIHVMSGFRTPQYNGPGGDGRASLSRHMWGDAADVWIDNDSDGMMDDLNGDRRIDIDDAAVIMRAVERVERKYPQLIGGAGTYPTTSTHGPYIHIDARGYRARW